MELLNRLQKGDKTAYEEIFRQFYEELFKHAYILLEDKDEAKDAVQDTFVYLLSNDIQFSSNLKGYLHVSVHNRCLQILRKEKVKIRHNGSFQLANGQVVLPDLDMEQDKKR